MTSKRCKAQAAALALALSALVAACGSGSSSSSTASSSSSSSSSSSASAGQSTSAAGVAPAAGKLSLAISGYAFHPAAITVAAGTRLTFTNHDQTAHTATSSQQTAFDTGTVNPGRSAIVTLNKPGTYAYYCQFHAFMRGTIVVR